MKEQIVESPSGKKAPELGMENSDSESDVGDPRLDTHKTSKSSAPPNREKTNTGTKEFAQANSLWTTNEQEPEIDENVPDLMEDSDEHTTIHPSNSNLNNTFHERVNTLGNGNNTNQGNYNNQNSNSNQNTSNNKIQSEIFFQGNSLQTGVFRELIPYNGSNLTNEVPTASFQPEEELFKEGVTGRLPAKLRCHRCMLIVESTVSLERNKSFSFCNALLGILACTFCCCPILLDQCKDAVHYCPSCGIVLGVKNF